MKENKHQDGNLYMFPLNVVPPALRQLIIEANKAATIRNRTWVHHCYLLSRLR